MDRIIASCGMICTNCSEYIATQTSHRTALEQIAARYRKEFHKPDITAESLTCHRCLGDRGRLAGHCLIAGFAFVVWSSAPSTALVALTTSAKDWTDWDQWPDERKEYRAVLDEIRRSLRTEGKA